ncbi:hypothetical protein PHYSODRAFT_263732 [Phytophthora sojae]|uniref:Uncharacterized protein n=1 Tax=Phytophthora sojae (strain P6497) TaxID=1094619 RepID=G4ZBF1_PHYSP|nr:hypothetical protein PHYSODRAFT_263732 [Phytophthora sojae]EGZ19873.1 hypothetical protein PHYSODRAFT_263732 [Phytophthora sojae]|eukprot:XP_009522590.1 hypothetical protein PHYSODRAFT_263732 [Phytophthora sojae]
MTQRMPSKATMAVFQVERRLQQARYITYHHCTNVLSVLLETLPLEQRELALVRLMLLMFEELDTLMPVALMARILLVLGVQLLEVVSQLLLQMLGAVMLSHWCVGTSDSLT